MCHFSQSHILSVTSFTLALLPFLINYGWDRTITKKCWIKLALQPFHEKYLFWLFGLQHLQCAMSGCCTSHLVCLFKFFAHHFPCSKFEGCCYSILLKNSHPCVERAMHHDCPICFEVSFCHSWCNSSMQTGGGYSLLFFLSITNRIHPFAVSFRINKWCCCSALWPHYSHWLFERNARPFAVSHFSSLVSWYFLVEHFALVCLDNH